MEEIQRNQARSREALLEVRSRAQGHTQRQATLPEVPSGYRRMSAARKKKVVPRLARTPRETPIAELVERLWSAVGPYTYARCEANWTNGYRVALHKTDPKSGEEGRMYVKEMKQWEQVDGAQARTEREFRSVLRAARKGSTIRRC